MGPLSDWPSNLRFGRFDQFGIEPASIPNRALVWVDGRFDSLPHRLGRFCSQLTFQTGFKNHTINIHVCACFELFT